MSFIDKTIAKFAPQWALKRERAKYALKAFYEVAETSRLRKSRTDKSSANARNENKRSAENIRVMARHMEENLDIASGALDILESNIVGKGIMPEPQVKMMDGTSAKAVNDRLLFLFDEWRFKPEVTHTFDYYKAQRMACRHWMRDGEMFSQLLVGNVPSLDHGTIVPFSIEMIEPDFCPFDLNDPKSSIRQGVELNAWGRARAYWFYKYHPGDDQASDEKKRVPANRIVHLKLVNRLHQVRGVSIFANVLSRLDDIKEIDESERVAARVAAAMAAYIKKGQPDLYTPSDATERGAMSFEPGMVFDDLLPGEDIGTINPNRPNNALIPFRDAQLRSGAAGLKVSYSSLSKNYNGTYSAQRQELVEQRGVYECLTSDFVHMFCEPNWWAFVDAARLSNLIDLASVDMETIYDVSHSAPPMTWIDPLKELQAHKLAIDELITSRSAVIRGRGFNPDQVNQEIVREREEAERLGIAPKDAEPQPTETKTEPEPEADPPKDESENAMAEIAKAFASIQQPQINVTMPEMNITVDASPKAMIREVVESDSDGVPTKIIERPME